MPAGVLTYKMYKKVRIFLWGEPSLNWDGMNSLNKFGSTSIWKLQSVVEHLPLEIKFISLKVILSLFSWECPKSLSPSVLA